MGRKSLSNQTTDGHQSQNSNPGGSAGHFEGSSVTGWLITGLMVQKVLQRAKVAMDNARATALKVIVLDILFV